MSKIAIASPNLDEETVLPLRSSLHRDGDAGS